MYSYWAFAFAACWPWHWPTKLLGSIFIFTGVQYGENTEGIAGSTKIIGVGGPRRFTVDPPLDIGQKLTMLRNLAVAGYL